MSPGGCSSVPEPLPSVEKFGIDERDRRQLARLGVRLELRERRLDVVASPAIQDGAAVDDARGGQAVGVELPGDVPLLELVEDRRVLLRVRELRQIGEGVVGLAEAGRRDEVHPVGPRRPRQRAVVVVGHREGVGQLVVERDVGLVVPPHGARPLVDGRIGAGGRRLVVDRDEAVHLAVVDLGVGAEPRVIGVGRAHVRGVGPRHGGAVDVGVGRAGVGDLDVGAVAVLVEVPQVAVERVVFHHHHDDVVDRDVGRQGGGPQGRRRHVAPLERAGGAADAAAVSLGWVTGWSHAQGVRAAPSGARAASPEAQATSRVDARGGAPARARRAGRDAERCRWRDRRQESQKAHWKPPGKDPLSSRPRRSPFREAASRRG